MRIRHGAAELTATNDVHNVGDEADLGAESGGVVLTLRDDRIIDADTGDVNEAEDELENVELVERAKAKVHYVRQICSLSVCTRVFTCQSVSPGSNRHQSMQRNNELRSKKANNAYGLDAFGAEAAEHAHELLPQYHDEKEAEEVRASSWHFQSACDSWSAHRNATLTFSGSRSSKFDSHWLWRRCGRRTAPSAGDSRPSWYA